MPCSNALLDGMAWNDMAWRGFTQAIGNKVFTAHGHGKVFSTVDVEDDGIGVVGGAVDSTGSDPSPLVSKPMPHGFGSGNAIAKWYVGGVDS